MSGTTFQVLRAFVFALNLIFWLAGLGILGVGLWLRFDPAVSELIALNGGGQNLNLACYLMIAAGFLMSIVGFLGCCGAWRLNQCMLITFFAVLVIAFCLELACAVVAYTHQDLIRRFLDNSMYEALQKHYGRRPEYTRVLDQIQTEFECCGVRSYKDWLHSSWVRETSQRAEIGIGSGTVGKVPRSCCNKDGRRDYPTSCGISFDKLELWTYEAFLHSTGCSDALYQSVLNNLDVAIITSVIVGIIQLVGMFLSLLLSCCINAGRPRKYEAY
ncbi:Tetraspanin family protein [Aphelenchoides avenae]|nr:Tetraspanin family protein [Aphelenchus avenae]